MPLKPPSGATQKAVLEAVTDGMTTRGEICEWMGLDSGQVSHVLPLLEKRGYIKRTGEVVVNEKNGRESAVWVLVEE